MNRLPQALVERLRAVKSVGAITGAGVSAESGIPTYRGRGGIYDDPETGDRTVEALSGTTLRRDPDRTWLALAALAGQAAGAQPNPGHFALADIERAVERFVLLTQNVDGLHRRAGSRNVIEIHGHLFDIRCIGCGKRGGLAAEELARVTVAPRCDRCRGVLRPEVVLFEELLPPAAVDRLEREFYLEPKELILIAGTSAFFPYVAEPVLAARAAGRLTVEVNTEPTELSPIVDFALRGPAGALLPAILNCLSDSTRAAPR